MIHKIIHRFHRVKKEHHKNHKTLLTMTGLLIILGILAVSSSGLIFFKQPLKKDSKAQGAVGSCRDNPVTPPSGYKWNANCSLTGKCHSNSDCPKNTSDGYVNSETSSWCFGFEGTQGTWEDWRCLQLIYTDSTGNGVIIPTSTPTYQPRPTSTPRPTVTPRPTSTPRPTPTITPYPTPTPIDSLRGEVYLRLKLKLRGVLKQPKNELNKLRVKVTLIGSRFGGAQYEYADFISDVNGVWSGNVYFKNISLNSTYKILIKGPKHIQKRICDVRPIETVPSVYTCTQNHITLQHGNNDLDFSNIYLLPGDLSPQDGKINSYDTSLVYNNLGKQDTNSLISSDVNFDGIVDTQDYSLVLTTLAKVKNDEK